ncbi:phage head closure protein [Marinobacter sp. 1Y8]
MRSGSLRHRVEIQKPVTAQNPNTGSMVVTWQEVAQVWASVEPLSAREFISAQAGQSEINARIVIRYRPGITAAMRIIHREQVFNIEGVLPDAGSGLEYLTLPVSTGVNDG